MRYEWDESKNLLNQRKHGGVSFQLAALVFEDERCLVGLDRTDGGTGEQRWHAIGAVQVEPDAKPRETTGPPCEVPSLTAQKPKIAVNVRLDEPVLAWLKSEGEGHLTRINDIFTALMEAEPHLEN